VSHKNLWEQFTSVGKGSTMALPSKDDAPSTGGSTIPPNSIDLVQMRSSVSKIPLWELNCQFGIVKKKHSSTVPLRDAMKHERRQQHADVTMLLAIRVPG
jgi:hypothetical protein